MLDSNFQKEIKSILFFALEYGMRHVDMKSWGHKPNAFIVKVHEGYMKAQKLIIQNLLILGKEKKRVKVRLKEFRKIRDQESISKLENNIRKIEYKEIILRKIADSIAWTLLKHDSTKVKRLYLNNPQIEIYNSNLSHELQIIEDLFETDKLNFALLTDITSFIQIADLLIMDNETKMVGFAELKEGKINQDISNTISHFLETQCDFALYQQLKDKDEKYFKQMDRVLKQTKKTIEVVNTINTGKGKDLATGLNVLIPDEVFEPSFYESILKHMLEEVQKKNYSLRTIDNCLIVGVYNSKNAPLHLGFNGWKKTCGIDFPTVDIRVFLQDPTARPLFLCNFSIDDKIKILNGEKHILMALDFNKWLEMLKEAGVKVELLSRKETERLNKVPDIQKPFEYQGKAIQIEYDGIKEILGGGIFEKMFNQFFRPTSIIDFIRFKEKMIKNNYTNS